MAYTNTELTALFADLVCGVTLGKRAGDVTETVTCKIADLPINAIESIFRYGFQRRFNDAVGGADTSVVDKAKAVRDMIERYKRGEVGRQAAEGITDLVYESRIIAANLLRKHKPDEWKALKDADKKALNARLDEIVAKNAVIAEEAQAVLDRKAKERARAEKLAVSIDL